MAPQISISQSHSIKPTAIKTTAIKKNPGSPHGMPAMSSSASISDTSNQYELMQIQTTMSKEDLAPDWVWEYGIMG
ncbi:MAG: hypothetical protein AAGA46_09660 [Cyanobacteria bacterium P01_F01_bin.13]